MNKHRIIGTTDEAISQAERELGRSFPQSFREWLIINNGRNLDGVHIYPVFDEREPRKTWDSIVRNFQVGWKAWLENLECRESVKSLLPFADFGTGDYYCFDYSDLGEAGEPRVVLWSHESDVLEPRGGSFSEFATLALAGEFDDD